MNKDVIQLTIPRNLDYISLVRLTASGIAYSAGLNVDEIEDIKVSIGEACINALSFHGIEPINLEFEVRKDSLCMKINDVRESISSELEGFKELELGLLIIRSLMDKVNFDENGIEMIKYIEDDDQ